MKYATTFVTVLILVAVLIPGPNLPSVDIVGIDKIVHVGLFGLWALAIRYDFDRPAFKFIIAFAAGLCFSLLTEVLQILVEGRTFDWLDMVFDMIGLALGLIAGKPLLKFFRIWK